MYRLRPISTALILLPYKKGEWLNFKLKYDIESFPFANLKINHLIIVFASEPKTFFLAKQYLKFYFKTCIN